MPDFLDLLAEEAKKTVEDGYYNVVGKVDAVSTSMKEAILSFEGAPVISEVKFASPSAGTIRRNQDLTVITKEMQEGGAVGISLLTEPKHFKGQIYYLTAIRGEVRVPVLMKDIIISPAQIEAAYRSGADAVLLINSLFERGYGEIELADMIDLSHSRGLEVLLEAHGEDEFLSAVETDADMIGINNRDLKTLEVDLGVTQRILMKYPPKNRVIVSESGIKGPDDIRFLFDCGANAFLVGTAIMEASSIIKKLEELVGAI